MIKCCKNCDKKGCGTYHDECPIYQEERKTLDKLNKQESLNKVIYHYNIDLKNRILKEKHKRKRDK